MAMSNAGEEDGKRSLQAVSVDEATRRAYCGKPGNEGQSYGGSVSDNGTADLTNVYSGQIVGWIRGRRTCSSP
jgi:hypothetical protein